MCKDKVLDLMVKPEVFLEFLAQSDVVYRFLDWSLKDENINLLYEQFVEHKIQEQQQAKDDFIYEEQKYDAFIY